MRTSVVFVFLLVAGCSTHLLAQVGNGEFNARVKGYEPNYALLTSRDDSDLDNSYRVKLSFKYEFSRFLGFRPTIEKRLHFSYTGDFDFFWGFRESAPVVGRTFNPALHYRIYDGFDKWKMDYVELSIHHRSNGQQTDAELTNEEGFIAASEFLEGNNSYIDGISRSSNYIQLESRFRPWDKGPLYVRLKLYAGEQENEVTWRGEPFAADFADYDRLEIIYSHKFSDNVRLSANWHLGDKGFATDSVDIGLQWNWTLPWFLQVHLGPMETLSDHTRSVNRMGIGFIFYEI